MLNLSNFVFFAVCCSCLSFSSLAAVVPSQTSSSNVSSYSTSGTEINGKLIQLDSQSRQSYTHYLTKSSDPTIYSFGVETSRNFDGMFVTFNEFSLQTSWVEFPLRTDEKIAPICTKYNIEFKYANGAVHWLCDVATRNYTEYFDHRYIMEDFKGFGTINVAITFLDQNLAPEMSGPMGADSWIGPQFREIPKDSIGTITFTLYKNCETTNTTNLSSCYAQDQNKCISSDLFCDGDINCVTSIFDVLLSSGDVTDTDTFAYDESSSRCSKSLVWEPKSTVFSGGDSQSAPIPVGAILFAAFGVVAALVSIFGWLFWKRSTALRSRLGSQY